MAQQGNKRRYVFHFDLNNTILMADRSKGLAMTENVCRIVCKSAWGKMTRREVQTGEDT